MGCALRPGILAALALASTAGATPLELPDGTPPAWSEAARLSGFELGSCYQAPCARLEAGELHLWLEPDRFEVLEGSDPELVLALARSRLLLGPPGPAPTVPAPSKVPAHAWAELDPVPEPAVTPLTGLPDPAPVAPPDRSPPPARPVFVQVSAGLSDALLLDAHGGVGLGPLQAGAGVRLDGRLTPEVGVAWSPADRLRLGAWLGATWTPRDCMVCTELVQPSGTAVLTQTSGLYTTQTQGPQWTPAARLDLGWTLPLGRRTSLGPRGGVAWSPEGPLAELAVQGIWSSR